MGKNRLEAFSDGVIAIIITIMVLELKLPHGYELADLEPLAPVLLGYVLSFVFVAIYWNNHHHMLHAATQVDGWVLWANMHLLFWLSVLPFVTNWFGEHPRRPVPVAAYAFVLLMCGIAWLGLQRALLRIHGKDSTFARAVGSDLKGNVSAVLLISSVGLAFVETWISVALFVAIAVMWFIPDRRFARAAIRHEG
jgi:uncharacterized membrane protein